MQLMIHETTLLYYHPRGWQLYKVSHPDLFVQPIYVHVHNIIMHMNALCSNKHCIILIFYVHFMCWKEINVPNNNNYIIILNFIEVFSLYMLWEYKLD